MEAADVPKFGGGRSGGRFISDDGGKQNPPNWDGSRYLTVGEVMTSALARLEEVIYDDGEVKLRRFFCRSGSNYIEYRASRQVRVGT